MAVSDCGGAPAGTGGGPDAGGAAAGGPDSDGAAAAGRDHRFHPLRVRRVVPETSDAATFVLDVPDALEDAFRYEAGQFCTFRATIGGERHHRSYSMSSAPEVDDELQVTVKRVPAGIFSNWMIDVLRPGDELEATCPAGVFKLAGAGDVVAFAGGSGITPVFSLAKAALATTGRRVRLFHANRAPGAEIFSAALAKLRAGNPGRLEVTRHFDSDCGLVSADEIRAFLGPDADGEYYLCGPGPFMDLTERVLSEQGVGGGRVHVERFEPVVEPGPPPGAARQSGPGPRVTVELGGRTASVEWRPGTTILQAARQLGLAAPSSCESGSCATCMARLVEGRVTMRVNDALTDAEVEEGWILTCQSLPTTPEVRVVYEED